MKKTLVVGELDPRSMANCGAVQAARSEDSSAKWSKAVVNAYSRSVAEYEAEESSGSCWSLLSEELTSALRVAAHQRLIVDVGAGTGRTLEELARRWGEGRRYLGIEPAAKLLERCSERSQSAAGLGFRAGSFEELPLGTGEVDYLYSILAFHWVTNEDTAAREVDRVLGRKATADLFFVGCSNGREFIEKTTPVLLRFMGLSSLLSAAQMRRQLTREEAHQVFARAMPTRRVETSETFRTYHDTLEGHWRWWVRIRGQLERVPENLRQRCEDEIRGRIAELEGPQGIPYTTQVLHVKIDPAAETHTGG